MSVIKVENLIKNYRKSTWKESEEDVKVLKGISFEVKQGEFVGIMGKSGCGEDTDSLYGDKLAEIRNQKIGFVFQDFYLMDSLSVEENIMLPMILKKSPVKEMQKKAKNLAEQFEIGKLLRKNPYELSGGERQRVAICRALINDPELILADEPTGNLDSHSGQLVIDTLKRIHTEYKKTIIMVTHDPKMASYCDRILLLKDGKILEEMKRVKEQERFYFRILGKMADL